MSDFVEVAVGVLVEQRGPGGPRILIARRPEGVVLAGCWELPGGKLEAGETAEACLRREFEEELGLRVIVGAALDPIEHAYDHAQVRIYPFYCSRVVGEPRNRQVAEHRWVRPAELAQHRFPPANDQLMRRLAAVLGRA